MKGGSYAFKQGKALEILFILHGSEDDGELSVSVEPPDGFHKAAYPLGVMPAVEDKGRVLSEDLEASRPSRPGYSLLQRAEGYAGKGVLQGEGPEMARRAFST
ncbi:hypothetical protein MASR2M17_00210 [Aminivibrio sp.]